MKPPPWPVEGCEEFLEEGVHSLPGALAALGVGICAHQTPRGAWKLRPSCQAWKLPVLSPGPPSLGLILAPWPDSSVTLTKLVFPVFVYKTRVTTSTSGG